MDTNQVKQDAQAEGLKYWAWFKLNAGRAILTYFAGAFTGGAVIWVIKTIFKAL